MKHLVIVLAATASCAPLWAQTVSGNQFNPALSLIINGGFADYSDGSELEIAGFPLVGEAGQPDEGFGLFEAELNISSNVDDAFYGNLNLGIHQDDGETEVDIEEAWFQTLSLPYGLTAKAGKFRSELGYLNPQHPHSYDFVDAPLLYSAMVGGAFADTGAQLTWLAPTDKYLELGVEYTRGDSFPSGGSGNDGKGAIIAFAKTGGDIGNSQAWQMSVSHLRSSEVEAELSGHAHGGEEEVDNEFVGESTLSNLSLVWKWSPRGNSKSKAVTVQGEYMSRSLDGGVTHDDDGDGIAEQEGSLSSKQNGFYLQSIYKFAPQWRAGLRYSRLTSDNSGSNDIALEEVGFADEGNSPKRLTAMFDYSHSEFSRLRFQVAHDQARHADEGNNRVVFLQYIHSLGAHGAHRF